MTTAEVGRVTYLRGGQVESQHEVHVVIVNVDGQLLARSGDAELLAFPRSSSKPVQALPLALAAPELPQE